MELNTAEECGITRVSLSGKLDAKGAEAIENHFIIATKGHDKVAVDLSGLDYIASIGIRILVMAGKAASRQGGKMVVFGANDMVAKVLTASGLPEIVPLHADWTSAQAAMA
jgi:anti-anti-sigma factor